MAHARRLSSSQFLERAGLPVARRAAAAAWKSRRGGSARRRAGNSWPLSCLPSPYRVASHRCLRAAGTAGVRAGVSATSAALHRFRYPARMLGSASRRPRQDLDRRWAAPSTWLGLPLGARTTRSPATTLWAALKSRVRVPLPRDCGRVSQGAERRSRETSRTVCLINATPRGRNQGQLTAPAPRRSAAAAPPRAARRLPRRQTPSSRRAGRARSTAGSASRPSASRAGRKELTKLHNRVATAARSRRRAALLWYVAPRARSSAGRCGPATPRRGPRACSGNFSPALALCYSTSHRTALRSPARP